MTCELIYVSSLAYELTYVSRVTRVRCHMDCDVEVHKRTDIRYVR